MGNCSNMANLFCSLSSQEKRNRFREVGWIVLGIIVILISALIIYLVIKAYYDFSKKDDSVLYFVGAISSIIAICLSIQDNWFNTLELF